MLFKKSLIAAAFACAGIVASSPALAQDKLTVWWVKGFYKSEDDALFAAIKKFGVEKDIDYISTGGGAFLEFLEGKKLPAIAALEARYDG